MKHIAVSEKAYELLKQRKHPGQSFGGIVDEILFRSIDKDGQSA